MAGRFGLGPVFASEWRAGARRGRMYAGRSLFVTLLLLALTGVWAAQVAGRESATIAEMARVARAFFGAIVLTELLVVMMAAPAATAGAICQEKERGNLDLFLVTDLSDSEIVLGILAARLVPVLALAGCAVPVLSLCGWLGGVDPEALAGSFLVTADLAVVGTTIALAFSVWGSKAYEVLLASYAVYTVWFLWVPVWEFFVWLRGVPPVPRWLLASNPVILAFAPYERPGTVTALDYLGFTAASLVGSGLLLTFVVGRMRRVVLGQAERPRRRRELPFGLGLGPSLDRRPLAWYEWHRKRPTSWGVSLISVYAGLALTFTALAVDDCFRASTPAPGWFPAFVNAFQVALGLPLILMVAATALAEERSRGSLDVLLTTPFSTRRIVLTKWWCAFRRLPPLVVPPACLVAILAYQAGNWWYAPIFVAYLVSAGAAWTSIGLATSLWVRRPGRAVSAAVLLYAFVNLAWAVVNLARIFDGPTAAGLSEASPFYGAFNMTYCARNEYFIQNHYYWCIGWTLAYALTAAGRLTVRCYLSRILR